MTNPIAEKLAEEHRDIDAGIAAFKAAPAADAAAAQGLAKALAALRRHIYIEEQLLFPPLRSGRAFGAIMAMLREHGEMWPLLDKLEPLAASGGGDAGVAGLLAELEKLLLAHNDKEEKTVYGDADAVIKGEAAGELLAFAASGTLPAGWKCERIAGGAKPPFGPRK